MYPQSPWGYPPSQPTYIPVPQGTDPNQVFRIVERLEKREEKRKKREEEEKKKKAPEKPKAPTFSGFQVLLMLMAFGLPVGGLNLMIMNLMVEALKAQLFKP